VDFLDEQKAIENLREGAINAVVEGEDDNETLRFSIAGEEVSTLSVGAEPWGEADHTMSASDAGALASLLDDVLHAMHIQTVLVMPVQRWRGVLDLVAFELATDEDWQEIDAEASLHQRSRDPLEVPPDQRQTMLNMVKAVLESGDGEDTDLNLLAPGVAVVIEVRHPSELRVHSGNRAVLDTLAEKLNAK
jgi:hypothetical protein